MLSWRTTVDKPDLQKHVSKLIKEARYDHTLGEKLLSDSIERINKQDCSKKRK